MFQLRAFRIIVRLLIEILEQVKRQTSYKSSTEAVLRSANDFVQYCDKKMDTKYMEDTSTCVCSGLPKRECAHCLVEGTKDRLQQQGR